MMIDFFFSVDLIVVCRRFRSFFLLPSLVVEASAWCGRGAREKSFFSQAGVPSTASSGRNKNNERQSETTLVCISGDEADFTPLRPKPKAQREKKKFSFCD